MPSSSMKAQYSPRQRCGQCGLYPDRSSSLFSKNVARSAVARRAVAVASRESRVSRESRRVTRASRSGSPNHTVSFFAGCWSSCI